MAKIVIGIDPGKNGGIAILNGKTLVLRKMPETARDLLDFFKPYSKLDVVVVMEKVGGMPKMGGVPMFNFGRGYGNLETTLLALELRTEIVRPQMWQKTYELGTKSKCASSTEWKNKLKARAQQLFPKSEIFLWGSDAALIAEYGRRNNF